MKKLIPILLLCVLAGCAGRRAPKQDLNAMITAAPRSILIVPIVNKSLDVDAANYVLSTLPTPLAEKGYYVFPVNTTKFVLEQEGYYEGDRVHQVPAEQLAKLFGADSVLYVTINRWDAQYFVISTHVTVDFDYRIVGRDGAELWKETRRIVYDPNGQNNNGLLGMLINAVAARAAPDYMPLARQAHSSAFVSLPTGPYRPVTPKK
ncbi:MAG: DUF799 domain-containing protein [Candidatus Accumulibacter sp.]|jgi:hypothetical protein|nr:DUF799 domain-containing protein [Accumulibacter sp.]